MMLRTEEEASKLSDRIEAAWAVFEREMKAGANQITAFYAAMKTYEQAQRQPVGAAMKDVMTERRHQIEQEGWSAEHDDLHEDGELALAAACYATPVPLFRVDQDADLGSVEYDPWPWAEEWDKRQIHDRRRQLVIAAALILAEIERLDRKPHE